MNMYKLGEALAKQAGPLQLIGNMAKDVGRGVSTSAKAVGTAAKALPTPVKVMGAVGAGGLAGQGVVSGVNSLSDTASDSFLQKLVGSVNPYLGAGVGSLAGAGLGAALSPKRRINPLTGEEEDIDMLPILGGAALGGLGGYYAQPHIAKLLGG